jgi:2-iminobutanoate/2-iminopropanoate deaminase
MSVVRHNPAGLYPPYRSYCHAIEIRESSRLLVIAGINGYEADGVTMPDTFDAQAELIWNHLHAALAAAGMDYTNLVSLRFYLAEPEFDEANVRILASHLGALEVPRTVVCARLLDPRWKLEVEAMAAT